MGALAIVGCVAGIINVLAGGGSLLIMPTMRLVLDMEGPEVNGTSRVGVLIQNLAAIAAFRKKGFSEFRLSLSLAACAVPGSIAGAYLALDLKGPAFDLVLACIMIGVLALMAFKGKGKSKAKPQDADDQSKTAEVSKQADGEPKRLLLGHILMVGAGFYGGFIQAGVGFILMPILNRVMGMDLVRVNMHKVFIIAVYMVPALVVFAMNNHVLWMYGLVLAVGAATGGWIGSNLAVNKGETVIRRVFNVALIGLAIKLIVQAISKLADV